MPRCIALVGIACVVGSWEPTLLVAQRDTLLYRAAIAAADGAFAAGDTRGARRWLTAAPSTGRGWEWSLLDAQSRGSAQTYNVSTGPLWAVALSPDGRTIAAGTASGEVRLIDRTSGSTRLTLRHPDGIIYDISFSPDGSIVASAGTDPFVRLWNTATGAAIDSLTTDRRRPLDLAFDSAGRRLAASLSGGVVMVWEVATRRLIQTLKGHVAGPPVPGVAFLPDGRIASGSWDQHVRVWDASTGDSLRTLGPGYGHNGPYAAWSDVAADPRGRYLAAVGRDGLHIWSLSDWSERIVRGIAADVPALAVLPDGEFLLTGSTKQRLDLWRAETGVHIGSLYGHEGTVRSVAVSRDGNVAVSGADDGTIRVWDLATVTSSVLSHPAAPYSAAWSPDGRFLATAAHDGHLRVFESATGRMAHDVAISAAPLVRVLWSADGNRIFAVPQGPGIRMWSPGGTLPPSMFFDSTYTATAVTQSEDRRRIFTVGADRTLRIWDAQTAVEVRRFTLENTSTPRSIGLTRDGSTLVVGWSDGSAEAWGVGSGQVVGRMQGQDGAIAAVVGLPGSQGVVLGTEGGRLLLWNLSSPRPERRVLGHEDRISGLSISPDGARIVSTGFDDVARIWDSADLSPVLTLRGFTAYTFCGPFSPDGQMLALCVSSERVVRLYGSRPKPAS